MIDWRAWLLSALARKLGFPYQVFGVDRRSGGRALLFATTEAISHALTMQDCINHAAARKQDEDAKLTDVDLHRETDTRPH